MRYFLHLAAAGAVALSFVAAAQVAGGSFDARTYGAFRQMAHRGDFSAKVSLDSAMTAQPTEGVGALAGLRGEVTVIDGRLVVSCGSRAQCDSPRAESAALLATVRVNRWLEPVELARDLGGGELEAFILQAARDAGLDLSSAFAVRLRGPLVEARMHVVSAPNPAFGGHGSNQPLAQQDEIATARAEGGEVVGFYAPGPLRGIATHPGEAFHFHWVDGTRARTAHLDAFSAAKGSLLLLAAPAP